MRVLVAGDGAVGRALSTVLERAGLRVSRWSRSAGLRRPGGDEGALPQVAVLAVSDPAISAVAERLLVENHIGGETALLHTAGAVAPSEAFAAVAARVRGIGLMHPLRAFAGAASDADLVSTVFGVVGDEAGREAALALVAAIGGTPLLLDEAGLRRYHAAAALTSNHTLALVDCAVGLLEGEGLPRAEAERALAALLASVAANVAALGLPAALTGPISRGDARSVEGHLSSLSASASALYQQTGLATLEVARRQGRASVADYSRVGAVLAGPSLRPVRDEGAAASPPADVRPKR